MGVGRSKPISSRSSLPRTPRIHDPTHPTATGQPSSRENTLRDDRSFLHATADGEEVPGSAERRCDTPASRQRAVSAQARRQLPSAFSPDVRPSGPMSRRALRRLRGEQRGQEPLGPDALQFVLQEDDDAEEEGPKRGPGSGRSRGTGKEGVQVNNRFELVRSGAT